MVDRIQKVLDKLLEKEKTAIKQLLFEIKNNRLIGLDIKKLKGRDDIYRVRKGKIRIIYRLYNKEIEILEVGRRDDTTYRNFLA